MSVLISLAGIGGTLCQLTDFLCDNGEALAGFTGTRCFDAGIQRQQVGLEGDLVDDADDTRDLGGRLLDALHRSDRLAHHFARLFRILAGEVDVVGSCAGVLRAGIDLRGELVEGRCGLFQACCLLLGALGEIGGAATDFARARADVHDAEVHRVDGFFEAFQRRVEILLQLGVFAREVLGDAVAEIAL